MKPLIITSNCLRHLGFINRLREEIEINNSILEMDRITQENAQYAENNIEISQTTAEQAQQLETLMQAFKVDAEQDQLTSPDKKQIEMDSTPSPAKA